MKIPTVMKIILTKEGFPVTTVANGKEPVQIATFSDAANTLSKKMARYPEKGGRTKLRQNNTKMTGRRKSV